MPLIYQTNIVRADLKANRNVLYVFGDNMDERGLGGQAAEMRGEPNAVGIPTKHAPNMSDDAFFSDADFDRVIPVIDAKIRKLESWLLSGGVVIMSAAGIGTDRAKLAEKAPAIFNYIRKEFHRLSHVKA